MTFSEKSLSVRPLDAQISCDILFPTFFNISFFFSNLQGTHACYSGNSNGSCYLIPIHISMLFILYAWCDPCTLLYMYKYVFIYKYNMYR